jgi:hypothetical protein
MRRWWLRRIMDNWDRRLNPLLSADDLMDNGIRCHTLEESGDWYHATRPTVGEMLATGSDTAKIVLLADKHILLSQSSFVGVAEANDIPMDVFAQVMAELLTPGVPVKSDDSCHLDNL